MKQSKYTILLAAMLTSILAFGATYTDGNGLVWTYTTSSGVATLSGVAKEDGSALPAALEFPSSVNGATVTAIAEKGFRSLPVTSLKLPDTLKTINHGAFAYCTALETLVIPDSVTAIYANMYNGSSGAFAGCTSLKSVNLGSGLVTIGNGASKSNDDNTDYYAYSGVFGNCTLLEEVTFGNKVSTIGSHAFSECPALKTVTLPDSVVTIGVNAFCHNTSLESVSFGSGLTTIGDYAFYNCPELQTVVFRECDTPLLTIGACAFRYAKKLTTLTFNESLKQINAGAFANCTALETLDLPDSLTGIYANMYNGQCGAFAGCTSLKSVNLGSGLVTIGDGASNSNDDNPDYYAYSGVFGNCYNLEKVSFGPNILTVGRHAFSECRALKSLDFPDSLLTIGLNAFYNNIRLTRISFGANLQLIGECAFMGCVSLNTVSFSPATTPLLTIKSNAFKNCLTLASLTLSNAMPTLESGAFANCTMLRRITIPSILSTINSGVFTSMSKSAGGKLEEVVFLGVPPENLANAGLDSDVLLRYPEEYKNDWEPVIEACGFTNAKVYTGDEIGRIVGDSRYELTSEAKDCAIASIVVNGDTAIDKFVLTQGKVYDCVLRIVNESEGAVSLTLPSGFTYETFEGADPLTIPANSRNLLTITRTADDVFLVSREKLKVIQ